MKLLLISTRMGYAGVETLIYRMAKYLSGQGHTVDVLLMREVDKPMADELRKYAKVYIGWKFLKTHKTFKKLSNSYYDYIYTFSLFPLIYSLFIKQAYFNKAKLCFGVYHPLEYCWEDNNKPFIQQLCRQIISTFSKKNIFFMNEGMKDRHSKKLQMSFSESPIVPIQIEVDKYATIIRTPNKHKIVSIGRITGFKTYNFRMVDVISELKNVGYDFEYHIYGDGDQFDKLVQYVKEKKLEDRIFMHGILLYENLATVLKDAYLFVGVGTALVEAAACGVPCLQAIEGDKDGETYGFFNELTGYNLGEIEEGKARYKIISKILFLVNSNKEFYEITSYGSKNRALNFGMANVMEKFTSSLERASAEVVHISYIKIFFSLVNIVYWYVCKRIHLSTPFDSRYMENS